jgi:hypothetical protein
VSNEYENAPLEQGKGTIKFTHNFDNDMLIILKKETE